MTEETENCDMDTQCSEIKTEIKTEEEELLGKMGGFLCPECSEHFFYEEYFVEHIKEHHSKLDCVEKPDEDCNTGGFVETPVDKISDAGHITTSNLLMQELQPSTQRPYDSDQETATPSSYTERNLVEDHRAHKDVKRSSRSTCMDCATIKSFFVGHMGFHTGAERLQCSACSYASRLKTNLLLQGRVHTIAKPFKCSQCSFATKFESFLTIHQRIHANERPFKCSDCSYATQMKHHLTTHQKVHNKNEPLHLEFSDCSIDGQEMTDIVRHIRIHSKFENPYKCLLCPYSAGQKIDIRRHQRIHTNGKSYKCSECSYAAGQKYYLIRHQQIHIKEKPFKCSECSYAAGQKIYLIRHQQIHTREHYKIFPDL